jgi:hypothetical protein
MVKPGPAEPDTPEPERPQSSRVGRRLWVPLAVAIFFPASLIAQMWWTGIRFSTPTLAILVVWFVMTLALTISLLRKRQRYLDTTKR